MKTLVFSALNLFLAQQLFAQCSFTPTVTGDTLLCPNSNGALMTEMNYDSLKWYSRPYGSNPGSETEISGATGYIYYVNQNDQLNYFSVEASLGGCTERSAEVLLDGWMFLLPTASTNGNFSTGNNGEAIVCAGDTIYLEALAPYDTNIVWTNNGNPIAGADSTVLYVTEPGSYSFSGAPSICPSYNQPLGVEIVVDFIVCPTGTDELDADKYSVSVFPNPADEVINLHSNKTWQAAQISIFSALGQMVWQGQAQDSDLSIPVSGWASGVYFINIMENNQQQQLKVVVGH